MDCLGRAELQELNGFQGLSGPQGLGGPQKLGLAHEQKNWGSSPQAWRPPPSRRLQQMKKLIDQADSWLQLLKVS